MLKKSPRIFSFLSNFLVLSGLIITILLVLAFFFISPAVAADCETRAVWLNNYAFDSASRRDETLSKLQTGKFNTVFLASYPLNGNFGWSTKTDFETMLSLLKQNNFIVHVWLSNWDRTGSVDYTNPNEWQAQKNWALDWLKTYPSLSGVHLDYIRYGPEDLNPAHLSGVSNTVKTIYQGIKSLYPQKLVTASVYESYEHYFNTWERPYLPDWFKAWTANNPGNRYMASGIIKYMPNFLGYGQDAGGWAVGRFIDALSPMEYAQSESLWNSDARTWKLFLGSSYTQSLIMGLPWFAPTGANGGYNVSTIINRVSYGRSIGIKGYSIFEMGKPNLPTGISDWNYVNALGNGLFKNPSPSCLTGVEEKPGDLNHDGRIDILDLRLLMSAFTNIFDFNQLANDFDK